MPSCVEEPVPVIDPRPATTARAAHSSHLLLRRATAGRRRRSAARSWPVRSRGCKNKSSGCSLSHRGRNRRRGRAVALDVPAFVS